MKEAKRIEKETKPESKKENQLPNEDKKLSKPKPAAVKTETKNKSSTEKVKKKTWNLKLPLNIWTAMRRT